MKLYPPAKSGMAPYDPAFTGPSTIVTLRSADPSILVPASHMPDDYAARTDWTPTPPERALIREFVSWVESTYDDEEIRAYVSGPRLFIEHVSTYADSATVIGNILIALDQHPPAGSCEVLHVNPLRPAELDADTPYELQGSALADDPSGMGAVLALAKALFSHFATKMEYTLAEAKRERHAWARWESDRCALLSDDEVREHLDEVTSRRIENLTSWSRAEMLLSLTRIVQGRPYRRWVPDEG